MDERHIIAAIRNTAALEAAANEPTGFVQLLFGNRPNIDEMIGWKLPKVNLTCKRALPRSAVNSEFLAAHGSANVLWIQAHAAAGLRTSNKCLPDTSIAATGVFRKNIPC